MNNPTCLTLETAERILRQFDESSKPSSPAQGTSSIPSDLKSPDPEKSDLEKIAVQAALKLVIDQSDYQMLGICAGSIAEGQQALTHYASAFDYELPTLDFPPLEGAVYLKYNSRTSNCYADSYSGDHRGVLVSCQSDIQDGLNAMFGHLPLDLFEH